MVPLVDFDILKKVVNFIYDGEIVLESREEQNDFMDALATLQVEVTLLKTRIHLKQFSGGADCGPKSQTK